MKASFCPAPFHGTSWHLTGAGAALQGVIAGAALLLLSAGSPVNAAPNGNTTIANYSFTGNSLASSDSDPNSTAGDFVIGSGYTGFAAPAAFFTNSPALMVSSDHTPGTEADAISGNYYFSFTVTPAAGGVLKFGPLDYNLDVSNNSNAITESVAVRWSVDNFGTTLGTGTNQVNSGQSSAEGAEVDLSSFPAQSGPVEIRFYVYDDQNTQFSQVGIDSITLTGKLQAPPPSHYRVIDLGTLGGDSSVGNAINNAGQIVGDSSLKNGQTHAFLFENGKMTDLGVKVKPKNGTRPESHAYGINDAGQVVGSTSASADGARHACVFAHGTITDLGVFPGVGPESGSNTSDAFAINASGLIVGTAEAEINSTIAAHAAVFQGGQVQDLDTTLENGSQISAVNASGTKVGSRMDGNSVSHAAIFAGPDNIQDLPTLGTDTTSEASGINDAGVIVGASSMPGGASHAFTYSGGTISDLGPLQGGTGTNAYAAAINNHGDIVGGTDVAGGALHAFLYTGGSMYDLYTLADGQLAGFTELVPNAINDNGWIVGTGFTGASEPHAFLAIPVAGTTTLIAAKGDTAPGLGSATFSVIGSPAIDAAGDVAFHALVKGDGAGKGNNAGIWIYKGANGALVARTGDPAPGTNGATYTKLSDPVLNSAGALAFVGSLKPHTGNATPATDGGIWFSQNGTTNLIAQLGENAPGTPAGSAKITSFSQIGLDQAGGLELLANLKGSANFAATGAGIFGTDNSGALTLLDRKGGTVKGITAFKPLPGVAGQGRSVDTVNGTVIYLRTDAGAGTAMILQSPQANGFTAATIATAGQPQAAFGGAAIKTLGEPAVNGNGTAAFSAVLSGMGVTSHNHSAIAVVKNAAFNLIARTGDPAPDATGMPGTAIFAKLSDPVLNNSDRVAFIGTLQKGGDVSGANDIGVWSDADGTLKLIAQKGDDAPGFGGGKFAAFNQIVLPDVGGVVMLATLSGVPAVQSQGVWALTTKGTLANIVREGDALDVHGPQKTVKTLGIFQLAPFVMGQSRSFDASTGALVYQAKFTDGTWGIYKVSLP